MIINRFEEIANSKNGADFLNDLPFDCFFQLISDPELNISEEIQAVKIIDRYLNHRKTLPLLEEEDPAKDYTHLTEEEKKHREETKAKSKEEETKKVEEEKKKKEDDFNKLDPLGKLQATSDANHEELIK